jgi:hypothetical protein
MAISSPPRKGKSSRSAGRPQRAPVLKVTRYDIVSSFLIAIVLGLILTAISLFIMWRTTWRPRPVALAAIEILDVRAGFEDGDPEEDFPDIETPDDEVLVEEMLDTVIEDASEASQQAFEQIETNLEQQGSPQSGTGSGRPLGVPGGTGTGLPREQRWFVRFTDQAALEEYTRQLDFFKIELGVLFIGDKSMTVLSNLSNPRPTKKIITAASMGKGKIHFNWSGGSRKKADLKLLEKAGVSNAATGMIFHFYPRETQKKLFQKEKAYRNRPAKEIRRTYFVVKRAGSGYEFQVIRQFYF